jgi:hypothetical protein
MPKARECPDCKNEGSSGTQTLHTNEGLPGEHLVSSVSAQSGIMKKGDFWQCEKVPGHYEIIKG